MAVTPEEVRRVADLARLRLAPVEVDAMAAQLSDILAHVDAIQEAGAAAMAQEDEAAGPAGATAAEAHVSAPRRPDREGADPLADPVRTLAPEWREGFFVVPRLASHEEAREAEGGAER